MGFVHTNSSVSSEARRFSFQSTGMAVNKKNKVSYSGKSEIVQFSLKIKTETRKSIGDQNAVINFNRLNKEDKDSLFYKNTRISELSVDEASALIKDDGYFGIDKTSKRIIDFVIKGAGEDIDRLKAGREGVLKGFNEAKKAWGGELPDLCCKTIENTIKALDERISELGGNIMEVTA